MSYTDFENGLTKDDYALTILSSAAMHNNDTNTLAYEAPERHVRNVTRAEARRETTSNQINRNNFRTEGDTRNRRTPDILADYNSNVLSSRSMETLSFPASLGHPYMNTRAYGAQGIGSQISQNYANSLGILNAESYDDGRSGMRERDANDIRQRTRSDRTMPFGIEHQTLPRIEFEQQGTGTGSEEELAGRGKRGARKRKDDSAEEEDEARKKARGRPRVDTKDETAADRRRTQIRMAQRAYRHRKETTISSLEKQVQDLRGTNEEMSNIFISLYDFAIAKGLLQREPEFGQQLQSTTERFLALAKAVQDDSNHDENHEEGTKNDEAESGRPSKARRTSPKKRQEATPPVSETAPTWGGYTMSKDDSTVEEVDMGFQQHNSFRRPDDLQIVTRPTEDNASFPFDLMDLQNYRVEVPQIEDFSQNFFPQSQPPLPKSFNYNEFSFARRIHRAAIERAFKLITSTDPSEAKRVQEVFGLCLLYETKETIQTRMKRLISSSTKETLQEWQAPFVHLGGSGTYYPMQSSDVNGDLMPKFRTGYSMGPFSPEVSRVQEIVEDNMRCSLSGFEGEFFDPNDVEGYLRGRGLDIAPAADFVTGELDLSELVDAPTPKSSNSDSVASLVSPRTPRSPLGRSLGGDKDSVVPNLDFPKSNIAPSTLKCHSTLPFPLGFTSWDDDTAMKENNNFIDPNFSTMPGQRSGTATPGLTISPRHYERQTVTVNVKTLLEELLSRGVCLGRSPGFRPSDVNAAILAAVRAGF